MIYETRYERAVCLCTECSFETLRVQLHLIYNSISDFIRQWPQSIRFFATRLDNFRLANPVRAPWHVSSYSIFSHVSRRFVARVVVCTKLKLKIHANHSIVDRVFSFRVAPWMRASAFRNFFLQKNNNWFHSERGIFRVWRLGKCRETCLFLLSNL